MLLSEAIKTDLLDKQARLIRNIHNPQGQLVFAKGPVGKIELVCIYKHEGEIIFRVKTNKTDLPRSAITFDGFDLELIEE